MPNTMQHWNGDQMCVVDIETTGLDPYWNEILQICILPVDSNIKPRKDVLPFYLEIRPDHPERFDQQAKTVNKIDLNEIMKRGHDSEKAKDLLEEWIKKLGLPCNKFGNPKRILPLGQNYAFDRAFIQQWLGVQMYNDFFDYHYRDTMITAGYINDRAACHAEVVPFSKINLQWLAKQLNVETDRAHDALQDCLTCAEVYRQLLYRGLKGLE